MDYHTGILQLDAYRDKIRDLRAEMRAVQAQIEPQRVEDYVFATANGAIRLSALFGSHERLFIIHNMGAACAYCTLWADGYNGVYEHLRQRAAFVVSSPDPPAKQKAFAEGRGWRFLMVSHAGTSFAEDMGYKNRSGYTPGISAFVLKDGGPYRVSNTSVSPRDDFNMVWHLFDLIPGAADDLEIRHAYR